VINDLCLAERLAEAADEITRAYIGDEVPGAATKTDGSPVTWISKSRAPLLALIERERGDRVLALSSASDLSAEP
jgi:hypothetical protein